MLGPMCGQIFESLALTLGLSRATLSVHLALSLLTLTVLCCQQMQNISKLPILMPSHFSSCTVQKSIPFSVLKEWSSLNMSVWYFVVFINLCFKVFECITIACKAQRRTASRLDDGIYFYYIAMMCDHFVYVILIPRRPYITPQCPYFEMFLLEMYFFSLSFFIHTRRHKQYWSRY